MMDEKLQFDDLTKINVPFALLDDETQEALRNCGGPLQLVGSHGWADMDPPNFNGYTTYRQKPGPKVWWRICTSLRETKEEADAALADLRENNPGLFKDIRVHKLVEADE